MSERENTSLTAPVEAGDVIPVESERSVEQRAERRIWTVPLLPISKNRWKNMHWGARERVKKEWWEFVWALANTKPRLPRGAVRVRCDADVGWDKRGPLPDWHNLEMLHEVIADGLVTIGIIADDAQGAYIAGDIITRRGDGQTVLKFTATYED